MEGRHRWLRLRADHGELLGQVSHEASKRLRTLLRGLLVGVVFLPIMLGFVVWVLVFFPSTSTDVSTVVAVGRGTSSELRTAGTWFRTQDGHLVYLDTRVSLDQGDRVVLQTDGARVTGVTIGDRHFPIESSSNRRDQTLFTVVMIGFFTVLGLAVAGPAAMNIARAVALIRLRGPLRHDLQKMDEGVGVAVLTSESVEYLGSWLPKGVALNPVVYQAGFGQAAGIPVGLRGGDGEFWCFAPVFGLETLRAFEAALVGHDAHIEATWHPATRCLVSLHHAGTDARADFTVGHQVHVPEHRFALKLGR